MKQKLLPLLISTAPGIFVFLLLQNFPKKHKYTKVQQCQKSSYDPQIRNMFRAQPGCCIRLSQIKYHQEFFSQKDFMATQETC